ncbi:MAG: hypothetical protein AAF962_13475 [Actinomycetota bacterium]
MAKPIKQAGSDLDITLWFGRTGDEAALVRAASWLVGRGATPNGTLGVHEEPDHEEPFLGISDFPIQDRAFRTIDDLHAATARGDQRLVKLYLDDVLDEPIDHAVEVRLGLSRRPSVEGHPITLIFPESDLAGPEQLLPLLCELADGLHPAYGGVFAEYSMPDPSSVAAADASAFRCFFASFDFLGPAHHEQLAGLAGSAATHLASGVYVNGADRRTQEFFVDHLRTASA